MEGGERLLVWQCQRQWVKLVWRSLTGSAKKLSKNMSGYQNSPFAMQEEEILVALHHRNRCSMRGAVAHAVVFSALATKSKI